VENIQQLAENKQLKIEAEIPQQTPIEADAQRIVQVLTNLLANAVKYAPVGGEIKLKVHEKDSCWQFSVSDNGPGIDEENQKTVFDRYVQVDSKENRELVGSGLGLAICKGLVEAHGGTIKVDSRVGQGSTFAFTLPKSRSENQNG
jgi:signal transduction histidine kinase